MGLVEPGEEIALGGPDSSPLRRWSQALHSSVWWEDERQQASVGIGEVQTGCKENLFTFKGSAAVEQGAQRSCSVSSPGDFPRCDWIKP